MESLSARKTSSEPPTVASTALHKLAANLNNLDIHQLLPLVQRNLPAVITTTRGLLTQSHNMAMQTLDDVLGNCTKQMPYTKSVRIRVIAVSDIKSYTNDKLEKRQYIIAGVI